MTAPAQVVRFYTIDQVAELLSVHRGTVESWVRRGHLDCIRLNDSKRAPVRVTEAQLDEFVTRRSGYYRSLARKGRALWATR